MNLFLFHMEIFNLACNDGALLKMNGIECGFLIDEGLVNPACCFCLEAIASKGSFSEFSSFGVGVAAGGGNVIPRCEILYALTQLLFTLPGNDPTFPVLI